MSTTSSPTDEPVLITQAALPYSEQYARRQRRYALLMSLRLPCLVLAGVFYQVWWLALLFIVLSVPLPWMAVLIANDRPPRKAERANRFSGPPANRQLDSASSSAAAREPLE